jgi:hypothetical protein
LVAAGTLVAGLVDPHAAVVTPRIATQATGATRRTMVLMLIRLISFSSFSSSWSTADFP